jgi:hypothetical protein
MAIYITDVLKHVLNKLHCKMSETCNILHVFICIVVLLFFRFRQTFMLKLSILLVMFFALDFWISFFALEQ